MRIALMLMLMCGIAQADYIFVRDVDDKDNKVIPVYQQDRPLRQGESAGNNETINVRSINGQVIVLDNPNQDPNKDKTVRPYK